MVSLYAFFKTGDDLEWDEEYALQDFLKKDMAGSNGQARDGGTDSGQMEDGDERWTVVNGEGEAGHSSTPVSAKLEASPDGQCLAGNKFCFSFIYFFV